MAQATIAFNDKKARKFLKKLVKRGDDAGEHKKDYIKLISALVFKDYITHFEEEKGPQGKWKSWSPGYSIIATARGQRQILQDTGRLRNSFKPTNFTTSKQGIVWFNDAKTKNGFPYAFAHNEGGPKLPRRRFMYLSKAAQKDLIKFTLRFMAGERG